MFSMCLVGWTKKWCALNEGEMSMAIRLLECICHVRADHLPPRGFKGHTFHNGEKYIAEGSPRILEQPCGCSSLTGEPGATEPGSLIARELFEPWGSRGQRMVLSGQRQGQGSNT